ncbi:MAG: SURF1 family protein [Methylophilaceae bacterium]
MTQKQFRLSQYSFRPSRQGALILLVCVPLFIKLGLWQYQKATLKQQIQAQYALNAKDELTQLPKRNEDLSELQYKKVRLYGQYDLEHQILIDNQIEADQAGFYVITPLKLEGRSDAVLINRGWIAGLANRNAVPEFKTPTVRLEITGQLWLPNKKIFTLETPEQKQAETKVWQYLDVDRYQKIIPNLLPVIIKLDEKSQAGGFVRHWDIPASKIASNLGYAYQWFGFAGASIFIYIFTSFKKISNSIGHIKKCKLK